MDEREEASGGTVAVLAPPEPEDRPAGRPPPDQTTAEAPPDSGLTPIGVLVSAFLGSLR